MAQASLGDIEGALTIYREAISLAPNHAESLFNAGNALHALERPGEALAHYDRALAADPQFAEAHNNRGNVLRALERSDDALKSYSSAIAARLGFVDALCNRAYLLRERRQHQEALADCEKALAIRPNHVDGLILQGHLFLALNRREHAMESYDRAIASDPKSALSHVAIGDALKALGRSVDALARYDRALSLEPGHAASHDRRGQALTDLGRLDEAGVAHARAVELSPRQTSFYYNLAETTRLSLNDPVYRAMEEIARDIATLSSDDQIPLHFALAKTLEDNGDYKGSARHLIAGNALKRSQVDYDETSALAGIDSMRVIFRRERMRKGEAVGDSSRLPIFVVGMPRSGSTLVEQILSSHPSVFGAGEIPDFGDALADVFGEKLHDMALSPSHSELFAEQVRAVGANYLDRIRRMAPGATRIVNKMPDNFRFVGLIRLAFPHAHIIHTKRSPLDTCISCFSKLFTHSISFSYDLSELGRYYRAYDGLMTHWRSALPRSGMLELQYEELVADFDRQARDLIAYCGLDWDESCLTFYRNTRPVRTASATQVRRPIYASSVGRSRHYSAYLSPLINALGPAILSEVRGPRSSLFAGFERLARALRPN